MFFQGSNAEISQSIEAIGTALAVFEFLPKFCTFELISCNHLYEELVGLSGEHVIGQPLIQLFPKHVSSPLNDDFNKCRNEQIGLESEFVVETIGGEHWWRSIISPIAEQGKNKFRIMQTCVEITDKKILEQQLTISLSRFEAVVQSAYDGVITIDETQSIKLVNKAAATIFGYQAKQLVGSHITKLIPMKYRKDHDGYVEGFKKSKSESRAMQTRTPVRGVRKDGSEFPVEVTIAKINVADSTEMTAIVRDISEKSKLLDELLIASRFDSLTQLSNRRYFSELFKNEILRTKRFGRGFSLMMMDIDHFKQVNDTYGHQCGDLVLKEFAKILRKNLRVTDIIGRWGGEEFLVLLPEIDIVTATEVAQKLRKAVERNRLLYDNKEIEFTVSIGVSYFFEEHLSQEEMVNKVDKNLYKAKHSGRNCVFTEH